jgi:hypothetical protein
LGAVIRHAIDTDQASNTWAQTGATTPLLSEFWEEGLRVLQSQNLDFFGNVTAQPTLQPDIGQIGDLRRLEVQAANLDGSDTEVWYVRILSHADLDEDGDVDQSDFGLFQVCLSGTGEAYESGCSGADLDDDKDVDRHDFDAFAGCIAGSDSMPKG